jgi:hypothetical protein
MGHILGDLFGPGTWGAGGNLVAWVLCGALAGAWVRAKLRAQDALARLHHQEKLDQATAHHAELRNIAARTHQIAADTYQHHTGTTHPDAPGSK